MTAQAGPADGTIRIDTRIDESGFNAGVEDMEDVVQSGFKEMSDSMEDATTSWTTKLLSTLPMLKGFFGEIVTSAAGVNPVLGALAVGLAGLGVTTHKVFDSVRGIINKLRDTIKKLVSDIVTKFKSAIESFFDRLKWIFNYFGRIVFRSLVFEFIRFVRKVIETSHEINNMQTSVEELNRSLEYMVADLISYVFPNFNTFTQKLIDIVNIIRQVIAALKGQSTYTKVVARDLGEAGKAAKEAAGALAAFDEIDVLKQPGEGGGGGIGEGFEEIETPIDDEWVGVAERLAEVLDLINSKVSQLWETIKPFRDFVSQTVTDFYNSFLKPVAEWVIGPGWDEFIRITNELMQNSDWDSLAGSLDRFYGAASKLTIAVFEGLLTFYDRFLRPMAEWTINEGLPRLLDTLSGMVEDVDWDKLNESWGTFLDKVTEFAILNLDNILTFVEDILAPIGTWLLNEGVPIFFETLGNVLDILSGVLEALDPLWEKFKTNILDPLAAWASEAFIDFMEKLNEKLVELGEWIEENPEKVRNFFVILGLIGAAMVILLVLALIPLLVLFAGFAVILGIAALALFAVMAAVGALLVVLGLLILALLSIPILIGLTVKKFLDSVGGVKNAWSLLVQSLKEDWVSFMGKVNEIIGKIKTGFATAVDNMKLKWNTFTENIKTGFKTAINAIIGFFEKFINGAIDGINFLIDRINSIQFTFPTIEIFGQTFGGGGFSGLGIPNLGNISIPRLAEGAVIPPNAAFAAILGDSKTQTEILSPEDMLRRIVREESGIQEITIRFEGSQAELVRLLKPKIDQENVRIGYSMVQG